jgi:hypothetical protein
MLLLAPRLVRFDSATWDTVASVAIDRLAHRAVEDWSDLGPYPTLADVPEQRVRIVVEQEIGRDDLGPPRPGDQGTLTFCAAPAASDAGRTRVSALCVVLSVEHTLSLKRGAIRTITLAAISPDGASDPIAISDASDGQV